MRKSSVWFFCLAVIGLGVLGVLPDVWASGGDLHHEAEEIGKHLGVLWVVPFACMLLSIAVMPLAVPHFWHHHYGKVAAFWSVAFLVPFALFHGFELALYSVVHTIALEYVSFLTLQAKILRALQERIVEPLGGVAPVSIDVRFIAATNRDLPAMIADGKFREDLYYRLNVLEIRIPPLRERIEDIPVLVDYLLDKLGRKNNRPIRTVSREFLNALCRHEWRGNVRELENVLERALILCRADTLDLRDLPDHLLAPGAPSPSCQPQPGENPLEAAERQALQETLRKYAGHRERTAQALGISRRTLQYRLKKYGLTTR